ncbi:hypothetical protein TIFTF001_003452 [Ficus carica]|uniref:Uncharacterized protein n=1 Tax=Ficus carica TaxID=3494 RepID=A0AA87Z800_FICCA|nr:hypothetical protein TIFTF001_003452 [Ficus carica]
MRLFYKFNKLPEVLLLNLTVYNWRARSEKSTKRVENLTHRVGIGGGGGEAPPDDGAVGSGGVKRRRMAEHGGGRDSMGRHRAARPHARHGSALHDSVSRGESGSHMCNSD